MFPANGIFTYTVTKTSILMILEDTKNLLRNKYMDIHHNVQQGNDIFKARTSRIFYYLLLMRKRGVLKVRKRLNSSQRPYGKI